MANGRLSPAELSPVQGGLLRADAARAYAAFRIELHRLTGRWITWTKPDGLYRTFDRQVFWRSYWCARGLCKNAALPGTSNHGLGLAVDNQDIALFPRAAVLAAARATGFVFDVPSEPWHMRFVGGVTLPANTSVTPVAKPIEKRNRMSFYFSRNTSGTIWLETGIGRSALAQPSHLALFQRVLNNFPGWDTFLDVELDIMQGYKDRANGRIYSSIQAGVDNVNAHVKQFTDPILAKVQPVDAKALGAQVATVVAAELAKVGVGVDYTRIGATVEQTLTDNFAKVDADAKMQSDVFLGEMKKIGTIDVKPIVIAVEKAVAASKITITPEVAGTIAGAVRSVIAPDLVKLELKNQLAK